MLCWLRELSSKRNMLPPVDTRIIPLNWELRLLLAHFVLFMSLNQEAEKGVARLAGVIDPDYHRGNGTTIP